MNVNPYAVRPGDKIRTGPGKFRTVQRVVPCPTQPESVHLDEQCYDSRFGSVNVLDKKSDAETAEAFHAIKHVKLADVGLTPYKLGGFDGFLVDKYGPDGGILSASWDMVAD